MNLKKSRQVYELKYTIGTGIPETGKTPHLYPPEVISKRKKKVVVMDDDKEYKSICNSLGIEYVQAKHD